MVYVTHIVDFCSNCVEKFTFEFFPLQYIAQKGMLFLMGEHWTEHFWVIYYLRRNLKSECQIVCGASFELQQFDLTLEGNG